MHRLSMGSHVSRVLVLTCGLCGLITHGQTTPTLSTSPPSSNTDNGGFLSTITFMEPAWQSYAIIGGGLLFLILAILLICCCCGCCRCCKNSQAKPYGVATDMPGEDYGDPRKSSSITSINPTFPSPEQHQEQQQHQRQEQQQQQQQNQKQGIERDRKMTLQLHQRPLSRPDSSASADDTPETFELAEQSFGERKMTVRLDPQTKRRPNSISENSEEPANDKTTTSSNSTMIKASSFKSWQAYNNALEGKQVEESNLGPGQLKSALKSGAKLRRVDSAQRISRWREEVTLERQRSKSKMTFAEDTETEIPLLGRKDSKRKLTITKADGSKEERVEAYSFSPETNTIMATLGRKLSQRSKMSDLLERKILFPEELVTQVFHLEPTDRSVNPTWARLTPNDKLMIRKELNEIKSEMVVHKDSAKLTRFHADGEVFEGFKERVGERVWVRGYECQGVMKFYGPHKTAPGPRCGVELDLPVGKNSGTIKGHKYFDCKKKCGVLCNPAKVSFVADVGGDTPPGKPTLKTRNGLSAEPTQVSTTAATDALSNQVAIAEHMYTARNEDELTFVVGDKLTVLAAPEGGWWRGALKNGNTGWFPSNHVEVVRKNDPGSARPRSFFSLLDKDSEESSSSNNTNQNNNNTHTKNSNKKMSGRGSFLKPWLASATKTKNKPKPKLKPKLEPKPKPKSTSQPPHEKEQREMTAT
eukprot:m.71573 g.71573  ORF g.71573 m.71573 type:complete len:701 (-) comp24365_c3_seq1:23-2125(-)